MKRNINKVMEHLNNNSKVIEVTKDYYKLDNGDVIEYQFKIDDDITVEDFQKLLDDARDIVSSLIK